MKISDIVLALKKMQDQVGDRNVIIDAAEDGTRAGDQSARLANVVMEVHCGGVTDQGFLVVAILGSCTEIPSPCVDENFWKRLKSNAIAAAHERNHALQARGPGH